MKPIKNRPLNTVLDEFEQDIENNLDTADTMPKKKKDIEIAKLKNAAEKKVKTRNKEERINIRVFANDLKRIKEIAEEEGLPYQTLVTSVLHKFSTGRLISK